jgi:dTDP-4-dehydrorhamnose reductase
VRVFVTGAAGLLGQALVGMFGARHTVIPHTRKEGDITDASQMRRRIDEAAPDVVIHAAAIRDIDECERNPELGWRVNAEAPKQLVEIAREVGAGFALISSDAVFDGNSERPYVETDAVDPRSVYGKTKVAAEEFSRQHDRHWVFRVSVMFGPGRENFVNKGLCKVMGKEPYVVATDQLATATYTVDAARTMLSVIEAGAHGTYHVCNQGRCTRYELARRAVEMAGMDASLVVGKTIAEMNRVGPRPKYAVMEMRALKEKGFAVPREWEEALRAYLETLKPVQ